MTMNDKLIDKVVRESLNEFFIRERAIIAEEKTWGEMNKLERFISDWKDYDPLHDSYGRRYMIRRWKKFVIRCGKRLILAALVAAGISYLAASMFIDDCNSEDDAIEQVRQSAQKAAQDSTAIDWSKINRYEYGERREPLIKTNSMGYVYIN